MSGLDGKSDHRNRRRRAESAPGGRTPTRPRGAAGGLVDRRRPELEGLASSLGGDARPVEADVSAEKDVARYMEGRRSTASGGSTFIT